MQKIKTLAKLDIEQLPDGLKIILPDIPPSLNVYLRWHWAKRIKYLNCWAEQLGWQVMTQKIKPLEQVKAKYVFYFPKNRIRDLDNLNVKVCADLLKKAGIITDDNSNIIVHEERVIAIDRERPRVEIILTTVNPQNSQEEAGRR